MKLHFLWEVLGFFFCLFVHFTAKYWSKTHVYITVTAFTSDQRHIILLLKQEDGELLRGWKGEQVERKGRGFASSSQGEIHLHSSESRKLHFPSVAMLHSEFIFAYTRRKWEGISLAHKKAMARWEFGGASLCCCKEECVCEEVP